jgi:hypothetical protein
MSALCPLPLPLHLHMPSQKVVCAEPDCQGWVAPDMDQSDFTAHSDLTCKRCQKPIFKSVKRGRDQQIVPRSWYIYLGLRKVMTTDC